MVPILRGLNFAVRAGEILHLRGENGRGKTSLLRAMAGFLPWQQGEITWQGQVYVPKLGQTAPHPTAPRLGPRLAWVGCDEGVKPDLTLIEHLQFYAALQEATPLISPRQAVERMGLAAWADARAGRLSHGQKKRLGLARLLMFAADMWLLDEPFNGLDRASSAQLSDILAAFQQQGGLVILASHLDFTASGCQVLELPPLTEPKPQPHLPPAPANWGELGL